MCRGHEKPHMNISQGEAAVSALVYASEVAALSAVIGCVWVCMGVYGVYMTYERTCFRDGFEGS